MRLFYVGICLALISCGTVAEDENTAMPRPKGFPALEIPEHHYKSVEKGHPFDFEISSLSVIKKDRAAYVEPHWLYIYYPRWEAFIQLTYKPVNQDEQKMKKMIRDSYVLAYKHQMKANRIDEQIMTTKNGQRTALITLEGEVATPFQFFTTDSTKHFLRGAIYLNTATKNDSLAPIIRYLRADALHLIQTLRWK